MRCHICDATLTTETIQWNADHEDWDPCTTCLMEIAEVFSDPLDEDEITWLLEQEEGDGGTTFIEEDEEDIEEYIE